MYTIGITNNKGGGTKTTIANSLAQFYRENGLNVLLVDFDPQANATSGFGLEKSGCLSSYDLVIGQAPAEQVVVTTPYCDVIPASPALSGAAVELVGLERREYALLDALQPLKDRYDLIFIDCPPSLELLTLNALCAAEGILVPVQCEYYALEGLSDLMATLRAVKARLNPELSIYGLVLTMYDGRLNLSAQVAEEVRRHFPGKVFSSMIPRNVRLSEAPSHGLPVLAYDKYSRGAESYRALAKECIRKEAQP